MYFFLKRRPTTILVCCLFLLAFSGTAGAQTFIFSGKITDATTGAPLSGVSLTIDGQEDAIRTDEKGGFSISIPPGTYAVSTVMLGYRTTTQRVEIRENLYLEIAVESFENQLEEVVITSRQGEKTVETPSLGVSVLSLKAVKKLPTMGGEVDILRSLQTLPGISSVGEGANGVNIRGSNVDQNMIYFDDMPVFNPTHMFGFFSVLATDAIREFQMYKGSVPAKYGGRTASVLDVKMINPNTEKFRINGGIGLVSNRLTMEIPLVKEKLSLLSSARLSYNNYLVRFYNKALQETFNTQRLPDNSANFYDIANKLYYRPNERNVLSFSNYLSTDNYEVDSLFGLQNIVANRTFFRYGHQNFALHWSHFFNPEFVFSATAVQSRYFTNTEIRDSATYSALKTNLLYRQFKAETVYAPEGKYRTTAGLSLVRYDIDPANFNPLSETSSVLPVNLQSDQSMELAAYVAEEYTANSRLLIELGLRYAHFRNLGPLWLPDYLDGAPKSDLSIADTLRFGSGEAESTYGGLEPRLAIRYKTGALSSIKIGYNRTQQFLHLLSNNATPLPTARWKTANRYLKPQRSDFFTIGYFKDLPKSFWEFSVEAYYRQTENILDYVNTADLQLNPIVETQVISGRGRSYGLEFMLSKKRGDLTGWVNYTWSKALQQIRGDFPALQQINNGEWFRSYIDKPHTLNILANYRSDEHNSFSLTFTYSTGRPFTAPVGVFLDNFNFYPIYTERNNDRIADYHRLDFSWTISNPRMRKSRLQTEWVFAVYNLYGRKNAYSYFFKPIPSGVQAYKLSIFAYPILSITYNVKF